MFDVKQNYFEFATEPNGRFYSESQLEDLIQKIKTGNQKSGEIESIYTKSFETLAELMTVLNQQSQFQIIKEKYQVVSFENTVKLLMRCHNLMKVRMLVFQTLKQLLMFEKKVG